MYGAMKTVGDIMAAFGGVPAFSKFFNIPRQTCHTYKRRNYLPADRDLEIIGEAERRKIGLSFEDLARIRAQQRDVA